MYHQLLVALTSGRMDIISILAPQVFFTADKKPNSQIISQFEKDADCQVVIINGKVLTSTTGYIRYNGSRFDFSLKEKKMNNDKLIAAFAMLSEQARAGQVRKSVVDKVLDERLTRGKTRPGAKHKVGKVFKPVNWMNSKVGKLFKPVNWMNSKMTPAQYRRLHMGHIKKGEKNGYPKYY